MISGTIYLTVSQIIFAMSNFLLHAYLGRTLGPELYGIFGVISALILINEHVLLKGIFEAIAKFVAENEETAKAIIRITLKVLTIGGLAVGCTYFLFSGKIALLFKDKELTVYIRIFSFMIPITAVTIPFLGALNGLRQFGKQALISIVFAFVRLIMVLILVYSGFSVAGAVVGLLLADVFRLGVAKGLCRPFGSSKYFEGRKMLGFTLQCMVIALITSIVMNLDLLVVKLILNDNYQTGLYTSAVTITKMPLFIVIAISLTVLPTISKSISDGNMELTEKYIEQSLRMLLIFVLPVCLFLIGTSENILFFIYGSKYISASNSLIILLISAVFLSIKAVMYNVILASGQPRYIIFIGFFSLMIYIALLINLIPKTGLMGAATASAITHLFGLLLSYGYVSWKFMTHKIPFSLLRIILASLIVYLLSMIYNPSGIMLIFYYVILYGLFFILLIIMKEINIINVIIKLNERWEIFRGRGFSLKNMR